MRKQWIFIHMHISDPVGKAALSHGFRRAIHFLGYAQSVVGHGGPEFGQQRSGFI